MVESDLRSEKALGAALALGGVVVAVAIIAGGVLIGRARPAGPLELASSDTTVTAIGSGDDSSELPANARELAKSRIATESAEATASASSSETRTAAAGGTATGADSGATGGSGGTASDNGDAGGTTPPGGTIPGSGPIDQTSSIHGSVRHAVWGTSVPGVRVTLSPLGASTTSAASGTFAFDNVPDGRLVLVAVADSGSWLSSGGLMAAFYSPRGASVDFRIYPVSEAYGADWRDAAWWRSASSGELAAAASKVGSASSAFRGLTAAGAAQILTAARTGTPQQRARGELLATWLDLASGRLGFDTRVSALNVSGASAILPAHASALEYARAADSAASGDVDWNVLRRALSERALDTQASEKAQAFTTLEVVSGKGHGKALGHR